MIEVRLFGYLRRHAGDPAALSGTAVHLAEDDGRTLGQVLARVGVDPAEVGNVFLNGRLLPRSAYPITLGYPLASRVPLTGESYLETAVRSGDRVGVFPRNMAAVVV